MHVHFLKKLISKYARYKTNTCFCVRTLPQTTNIKKKL